jgi:RND family efflux transporter MFP subunit
MSHDSKPTLPLPQPHGTRRLRLGGATLVGTAAVAVAALWMGHSMHLANARQEQAATVAKGPHLASVAVAAGPTERVVTLLADTRPYRSVTLYSKVSGYLRTLGVDRGDPVRAGQVVAEIDAPETDSQYASAHADLQNKKRLAERAKALHERGTIAQQTAENADTEARMAEAQVAQLATLKAYEVLRAPFDGVVTARYADPGTLVQNAANNQTSSQPVITISDTSRLRVDVHVEQRDVPYVHAGDLAEVVDGANPERRIAARITRTADELDPRTRTLFVEIELDNADRFLVPGSFAYVKLHLPVESLPQVPANALVQRGDKSYVAVLRDDATVQLRPVAIATTDGEHVSLAKGAGVGERVLIDVPDEIADGSRVQPAAATGQGS